MLERLHFETREDWLRGREKIVGIGGSEAGAVVGMSPWTSAVELWEYKVGMRKPKDLSDNPAVQQGIRMEPAIRAFYAAAHPEYDMEYYPYDILYQSERPWLFATLDGELIERSTGRRGIFEAKDATPSGKLGWEKWSNGNLPINYLTQTLHQMLATGWDFVRLCAFLHHMNGDITIRQFEIERVDFSDSMEWLLAGETKFMRCVETRQMPTIQLRI